MNRLTYAAAVAAAIATLVGAGAFGSTAGPPTAVTLTLDGVASHDGHYGTFAATPPLCPSGSFRADGIGNKTYTCADGSGTFHTTGGGDYEYYGSTGGSWDIDAGTGQYTTLRGQGSGSATITVPGTEPRFHAELTGVAGFDSTPPSLTSFTARATFTRGRVAVTVRFTATDNTPGNAVRYDVVLRAFGRVIAERVGTTAAAPVTVRLAGSVTRKPSRTQLGFDLRDPLNNHIVISRAVAVR